MSTETEKFLKCDVSGIVRQVYTGYMACALALVDEDDMDTSDHTIYTLNIQDMKLLCKVLDTFIDDNLDDLMEVNTSWEQIGYDINFDRNGHGTGFLDRTDEGSDELLQRLHKAAVALGESYVYVGDDGLLYHQGSGVPSEAPVDLVTADYVELEVDDLATMHSVIHWGIMSYYEVDSDEKLIEAIMPQASDSVQAHHCNSCGEYLQDAEPDAEIPCHHCGSKDTLSLEGIILRL